MHTNVNIYLYKFEKKIVKIRFEIEILFCQYFN